MDKVVAAAWAFANGPLAQNPHRIGKQLVRDLGGYWFPRRGQYRVIHVINDQEVIVAVVERHTFGTQEPRSKAIVRRLLTAGLRAPECLVELR